MGAGHLIATSLASRIPRRDDVPPFTAVALVCFFLTPPITAGFQTIDLEECEVTPKGHDRVVLKTPAVSGLVDLFSSFSLWL